MLTVYQHYLSVSISAYIKEYNGVVIAKIAEIMSKSAENFIEGAGVREGSGVHKLESLTSCNPFVDTLHYRTAPHYSGFFSLSAQLHSTTYTQMWNVSLMVKLGF